MNPHPPSSDERDPSSNDAASRHPHRIRAMFSAIAGRYDFGNHLLSANVDRWWRRRAAEVLVSPESRRLLDVCCGTGDLALACARRAPRAEAIIGCDFAEPMLHIARAKAARSRARAPRLDFVSADATALPFPDGGFDAAGVAFGLRNLADRLTGLREMARVVRPGGRVLVLEFSTPPNRLARALYLFYFQRLLPRIARIATGSRDYNYLPASVAGFPPPETLAAMMRGAGLCDVRFDLLTGGIAAIHIGRKPG